MGQCPEADKVAGEPVGHHRGARGAGAPSRRALRPWGAAAALVLALSSLAGPACGGSSEPGEPSPTGDSETEEMLQRMVLQPEDVPPGLQRTDQTFTTNEQLVASSADPDAQRAEIERWGRILAYETTYLPSPEATPDGAGQAITSSSSLYETAEGAALSFADARTTVDQTDWQATRPDLQQFETELIEREGLADGLVWLRLSGLSPQGMVVEDFIIFRVGRARGFLRDASTDPGQDRRFRLDQMDALLTKQVQRVTDVLAADGPSHAPSPVASP